MAAATRRIQTQVLVIGGGATGVGTAWDAALRGFDEMSGNWIERLTSSPVTAQ